MKKIISTLFLIVLFLGGVVVFKQKYNRAPSSVDVGNSEGSINTDDGLADSQVKKQIKKALLKSLDWHQNKNLFNLRFENLKMQSTTFCNHYPSISLVIEAPDITYSGEHPEVTIQKDCDGPNSFANYIIDLDFLNDPQSMKKYQTETSVSSMIQIRNWENELQNKWRVKQIVFHPISRDPKQLLIVTSYEILSVLGYSIQLNFSPDKP